MKKFVVIGLLVSALLLPGCLSPDSDKIDEAAFDSIKMELKKVDCNNEKRLESSLALFSRLGVPVEIERYETGKNLVTADSGSGAETVIVGAHYDKTSLGCGAIDNWTGVVLLAHLAKWSKNAGLKKNYSFVAFDEEEKGLLGSAAMAREFEKNNEKPCAMINLDSFGFEKTLALANISDRPLLMLAADLERERGGSFSIKKYAGATSDSSSFRNIGVPAITFSGIGSDWRDYLHKENDQVRNISPAAVAENLLFLREFLKKVDGVRCEAIIKK